MELDELKLAWQTLDRHFERQYALDFHRFKSAKGDKLRSSLRPLFIGQLLQMLFGIAFIVLAAMLWSRKPDALPIIIAGIAVHAYGVACIILAGVTLSQIQRIDLSAPVVDIQKQLARLRTTYIYSGIIAGMPWWFLWVPILMVLAAFAGLNLYAHAPGVIWIGLGIGIAGLLATYGLVQFARQPSRPRLAQAVWNSFTGASLRRAQRVVDEVAEFERG